MHDVHVGLLEVPGVDVKAEIVKATYIAVEFAIEHVEVAVEVNEDGVEDQDLEALAAVQCFLATDGECSVLMLARVSRCAHLSFTAFLALGTPLTSWSFFAPFPWHPRLSPVSFLSYKMNQKTQRLCDTRGRGGSGGEKA